MRPNFFIAGVSRSGTTSLYFYMRQHPEVDFPELKEPRFFSHGNVTLPQQGPGDHTVDAKLVTSWSEYERLYANIDNKFVGDSSSEYLYNHNCVIPEAFQKLGDIPVILILRNPVDRCYSAYNNLVRDGRETLCFEEALEAEDKRKKMNYDEMWHYKSVSLYSDSVQAYLKAFSKVKVLIFEEFVQDKEGHVREVFDFLGASPFEQVETAMAYSKSGKPKSQIVTALFGRSSSLGSTMRKLAFSLLGRTNVERIGKHLMTENEGMSLETRNMLNGYFAEDIAKLETVLKRDLQLWKV